MAWSNGGLSLVEKAFYQEGTSLVGSTLERDFVHDFYSTLEAKTLKATEHYRNRASRLYCCYHSSFISVDRITRGPTYLSTSLCAGLFTRVYRLVTSFGYARHGCHADQDMHYMRIPAPPSQPLNLQNFH